MTLLNFAPRPITRYQKTNRLNRGFLRNSPSINISELNDAYQIQLTVPGISKEQIKLDVKEDQLIVASTIQEMDDQETGIKYLRKEYDFHTFRRVFNLNEEIDQHSIDASLDNGILTITLNKKEEAKSIPPRSITIK